MARHLKKFQGGRVSAREFHSAHAFPPHAKCEGCGGKKLMIRAVTMMPWADFMARGDVGAAVDLIGAKFPELVTQNVVQLKGPDGLPRPHVRLGVAYACEQCGPALERSLAKLPSYVVCDIHRGPAAEKVFSHGR